MVRSCKENTLYYACPNKNSLYVDRWSPESRDKWNHAVNGWLGRQERGQRRKPLRPKAGTSSAVGRNGCEQERDLQRSSLTASLNVVCWGQFRLQARTCPLPTQNRPRFRGSLWASMWGLQPLDCTCLAYCVGSTVVRQDHNELACTRFGCGFKCNRPPLLVRPRDHKQSWMFDFLRRVDRS